MNEKALRNYYRQHKALYKYLAVNSVSVSEILLKIQIYGKRWTQQDWAFLLGMIINVICIQQTIQIKNQAEYASICSLYNDILETITKYDHLDQILTNKTVVLTMISTFKAHFENKSNSNAIELICSIFRCLFTKFPDLWNMSWMYTTYRDITTKKLKKVHKLKNFENMIITK